MAMPKQSLGFIVLVSACLLCFTMSTEARVVTKDERQVEPVQFPNQNSVPSETPNHVTEPHVLIVSNEEKETMVLDATSLSVPKLGQKQVTERKWCIVKASTDDAQLDKNIQFCCNEEHQDHVYNCTMIERGGPCYNPTNKVSNASVVMNLYCQGHGKHPHNCDFSGSGLAIDCDPPVGTCQYPIFS